MQVHAASPRYLSKDDVPPDVLTEQRAVFKADQPAATDADLDRRLSQWVTEVALLEQPYIRDAGKKSAR